MKLRCLVVMPFTDTYDKVYDVILRSADALAPSFDIEFTRTDRERIDWDVSTNVRKHIDLCDFAIADVSEQNPNVFFEIGYLQAIGKPTVLLTQSAPPSAAWKLPYAIYSKNRLEDLAGALRPLLSGVSNEISARRTSALDRPEVYSSAPGDEIISTLRAANNEVDILATNLETAFSVGIVDEIIRLLQRSQARIRILVLNPDSVVVSSRASQLGLHPSQYRGSSLRSLAEATELMFRFPERCEIRLYDELPYQSIIRIDNVVFVGLLSSHRSSRISAVIKANLVRDGIGDEIMNQFEHVWAWATTSRQGKALW